MICCADTRFGSDESQIVVEDLDVAGSDCQEELGGRGSRLFAGGSFSARKLKSSDNESFRPVIMYRLVYPTWHLGCYIPPSPLSSFLVYLFVVLA